MWTSLQDGSVLEGEAEGLATEVAAAVVEAAVVVAADVGASVVVAGAGAGAAEVEAVVAAEELGGQLLAHETTCPSMVAVTQAAPLLAVEVAVPGQLLTQETTSPLMVAVTQTVESRFCWKGAAETVFVTASKALSHVKDLVDILLLDKNGCLMERTCSNWVRGQQRYRNWSPPCLSQQGTQLIHFTSLRRLSLAIAAGVMT